MVRGEDPWSTLLARPWLVVRFGRLPAGMNATWRGRTIILSATLGATGRRCALMHELVHEERRIGWPYATAATMEVEERTVRRITAGRLVPLDQLEELTLARGDVEPITAHLVAVEFDVTEDVAHLALLLLQQRRRDLLEAELARSAPEPVSVPNHGGNGWAA